jgi:hypothetical protein
MNNELPMNQPVGQRKTLDQWVNEHPTATIVILICFLALSALIAVYFAGYSAGIKDAAVLALQGGQ